MLYDALDGHGSWTSRRRLLYGIAIELTGDDINSIKEMFHWAWDNNWFKHSVSETVSTIMNYMKRYNQRPIKHSAKRTRIAKMQLVLEYMKYYHLMKFKISLAILINQANNVIRN